MSVDSGLRQRKQHSSAEFTEKYMEAFAENVPANMKIYIQKAAPYVGKAANFIEESIPFVFNLYSHLLALWASLAPWKPELLIPSVIGFFMCFFGGNFVVVIAAVEAYRICGYESSLKCLNDLKAEFAKVVKETKADDSQDLDKNGVPDVLESTPSALLKRKTLLFFRTVDPKIISAAISGLNAGFLAVIATLKLQFAKAITLGSAIAQTIEPPVKRFALPIVEQLLPDDYRHWAQPALEYVIRATSISIAWICTRILSAFHSAIRGGLLLSRNLIQYLGHFKYIEIKSEDSYIDEVVGFSLAALGLWFQLSSGFRIPFPLNLLFFPVTFLEFWLKWIVSSN